LLLLATEATPFWPTPVETGTKAQSTVGNILIMELGSLFCFRNRTNNVPI
jgi:hypothetical protein